jgi:hypothetical protein
MFSTVARRRRLSKSVIAATAAALAVSGGAGHLPPAQGEQTAPATAQPGRLAALRSIGKRDSVTVGNSGYSLDIQKVFKVHALVPRLESEVYGQRVYAGAFSLRTPGGYWLHELPSEQYGISGGQESAWLGRVTQSATLPSWSATLTAKVAVGYPEIWFEYRRTHGDGAMTGGLMGYDWAGRAAPLRWSVGDGAGWKSVARSAGDRVTFSLGAGGQPLNVVYRDAAGITGCLRFDPAPASLRADDTGLYWDYPASTDHADVEYLPVSAAMTETALAAIADRYKDAPADLAQTFGTDASGQSWIDLSASGSPLAIPASLVTPGQQTVDTVEGKLGVSDASDVKEMLPAPPRIEDLAPAFHRLPAREQGRVDAWIKGVLAHQQADGSFDFSQKRGFYDGMTCCALAEVYPQLSPSLQGKVKSAVRRGLDHLWGGLRTCEAWPAYRVAPEQPFFIQTGVDYPEIMGFTLQATALYCRLIDRSYLAVRWPLIARQFDQLRVFTDWTGGALANPGPEFYQIIPEGSLGGYIGWQALYHLSKMEGDAGRAGEARARAAYAWKTLGTLYAWRPEFGRGIVNGINNGALEVKISSPWNYFQYAWFTFLPACSLPHEDTFHVWRSLDALPWWQWTDGLKSRQRANDGANIAALLRAGYGGQVTAHREALSSRPVWWDTFDFTPVLMIPAEYWMRQSVSAR